jgi:hypothetical protein
MIACQQAEWSQQSVNHTQRGYEAMRETVKIFCATVLVVSVVLSGAALAGTMDPTATPAPTMRTLEEQKPAWNKNIPTALRFVDALDGTAVLDKETGVVWAKSPSTYQSSWADANLGCYNLFLGGRGGWRLPTPDELASLLQVTGDGTINLPDGNPFQVTLPRYGYGSYYVWSSRIAEADTTSAYAVNLAAGIINTQYNYYTPAGIYPMTNEYYHYWCVRSGL